MPTSPRLQEMPDSSGHAIHLQTHTLKRYSEIWRGKMGLAEARSWRGLAEIGPDAQSGLPACSSSRFALILRSSSSSSDSCPSPIASTKLEASTPRDRGWHEAR